MRTARPLRRLPARPVTPGTPISALRLAPDSPPSTRVTVSAPDPGSTGRSHNWGPRKTPSFRQTLPNFTETRLSRRSAVTIYSNSPHATSMDRSFTASAIRHRFSTKFSRDRSGTAALTWITPTILATTGPAAQQVPRRSAILIESAMAHPGIPRTPQEDAARRRWKAAAARAFSTVSRLTDRLFGFLLPFRVDRRQHGPRFGAVGVPRSTVRVARYPPGVHHEEASSGARALV